MRLNLDEVQQALDSLRMQCAGKGFAVGKAIPSIRPMPRTPMAPRATVCPLGVQGRSWTVAVRAITASGIVFLDNRIWMDGERFILKLPRKSYLSPMTCSITHWQPIDGDFFVISANFVRPIKLSQAQVPLPPQKSGSIDRR